MKCNMSINENGDVVITDVYEHWEIIIVSSTYYVYEINSGCDDQLVAEVPYLKTAYDYILHELT